MSKINFNLKSFLSKQNNTIVKKNDFLTNLKEIAKESSQGALSEILSLEGKGFDYEALKNIFSKYENFHKAYIKKYFSDKKYISEIDELNKNYKIIGEEKEKEVLILRDGEGRKILAFFMPKTFNFKEEFEDYIFISSSLFNYYFTSKLNVGVGGLESFDFKDILQYMETKEISDFHIEAQDFMRFMYTARIEAGKDATIDILQENIRKGIIENNLHQAKLLMGKDTLEEPPILSGLVKIDVTNKRGRTVERTYRINIMMQSIPPEGRAPSVSIRRLKTLEEIENLGLDGLGYIPEGVGMIRKMMSEKKGVNLVAGATNSGKSTLLAAMLNELYRKKLRIMSVENPIEIVMNYPQFDLSQYEGADEKFKLTREKTMNGFLRHDPNIVLFSELRDEELPDFVELGLRGHASYATIHAGSVSETILRLLNSTENHLSLITALRGIVVQDLLLKKCPHCKGSGCEECEFKGYKGVVPVYEMAMFHDLDVSELITSDGKVDYKVFFDFKKMQEMGFLDYISREYVIGKLKEKNILYDKN